MTTPSSEHTDLPAAWPHGVPRDVEIPDEPLTALLDRAVRDHADRVAVDFLGRATTYRQLADLVDRGARVLHELGVGAGDRVALVMPNCTAHVVAFWATLRLGAVVVEHNPTYTAEELAHQLADSGATVALVWEQAVPRVLEAKDRTDLRHVVAVDLSADLPRTSRWALKLPVAKARETRAAMRGPVPADVPHWDRLVRAAVPYLVPTRPSSGDVALLQYTGGTTGTPKAAVLTHRNLVANSLQGTTWTQAAPGTEVVYAVLPFFHAFGLTLCLVYSVRIAATIVVLPSFDPERVLAAQRRRPGTFLPAVPPMLERLAVAAEKAGADLTSFRYSISGAMALPRATAERWERVTGGIVAEGYGMTETSPVALGNPLSKDRRPGSLGLPFPSTRVRIVDQDDPTRDVAPGEQGELLISGPQVFQGYWKRPEETAHQLLEGGWLRTGDVVRMEDDGMIVLLDRMKEMIVTGGFKVYPSQVEDHLRGMPGVRDVAVVGEPAGDMGEHVVAAVVLDDDARGVDLASVREWCETRLARYALPRRLVVLKDLPRSQVGKVLRRVVRDEL
ncbi:AMP-binding protein [Cellulomonas wangsupingiae]|uniref:AMP-binding protein n=1 Tax=Cellulomonas wangsupingiae TaxID=2968085 RepID=A0ABY5K8X0_9CELL|nr:AMP-binding protein [Cellulomonas wangsupingiae]MCC2334783.1 AMP-binding protein [Cellulomonas wangsupingiae]MCM0638499.1 AMP-binding protein [Cellulomonas wangsupingiae]UUI66264.1 AMP-binding protein [Cellulomonas wangsupingiae]